MKPSPSLNPHLTCHFKNQIIELEQWLLNVWGWTRVIGQQSADWLENIVSGNLPKLCNIVSVAGDVNVVQCPCYVFKCRLSLSNMRTKYWKYFSLSSIHSMQCHSESNMTFKLKLFKE